MANKSAVTVVPTTTSVSVSAWTTGSTSFGFGSASPKTGGPPPSR